MSVSGNSSGDLQRGTTNDPARGQWWRDAVFYQLYVRSFADGNGDGNGDLIGLRERLPYLRDLGVDALWLNPFYRSPMADGGYDIADPFDVDPLFGTLADFDAMLAEAHRLGIRVTVDVVPNHLSNEHEWFQQALRAGPGSGERARFVFRPGRGDGSEPPNNWQAVFGGPAWERVPDGEWYLHMFAPEQPDVEWRNPEVADYYQQVLRFWLDRGVDGFRIDVAHGLVKDEALRDNPHFVSGDLLDHGERPVAVAEPGAIGSPATDRGADPGADRVADPMADLENNPHAWNQPEVHDVYRSWRALLNSYDGGRMAVGEVWVHDDADLAKYVRPDELHQVFNFRLLKTAWNGPAFRRSIDQSLSALAEVGAPSAWVLSNHDVVREVTRYGGGAVGLARARAAALLALALPGAIYLYNGEELGLPEVTDLPEEMLQDPTWERSGHTERGRDGCRVPLPWSGTEPPFGFAPPGTRTWLPQPADWADRTVAAQEQDAESTLNLFRAALRLRRAQPALGDGTLRWRSRPDDDVLVFERPASAGGAPVVCAINLGAADAPLPAGSLLLGSDARVGAQLPPDAAAWIVG